MNCHCPVCPVCPEAAILALFVILVPIFPNYLPSLPRRSCFGLGRNSRGIELFSWNPAVSDTRPIIKLAAGFAPHAEAPPLSCADWGKPVLGEKML